MADWRIVTPTRAPIDDEIFGVGYIVLSPGKISIMYSSSDEMLSIMFQNVQPVVRYYYDFLKKEWKDESFSPIDITTVDLTVPESAISSATTKTSYFDIIAYEKGTTACKLAVANEAKTLIRNALISKGVDVPDTTPFRQYAGKIEEIQSGSNIEILTFDIQTDDFTSVSSWWGEDMMDEYISCLWKINGPYVFKSKTYNSLTDLIKDVPSKSIYFSVCHGNSPVFMRRQSQSSESSEFEFIFKNAPISPQKVAMIVDFGRGV